MADTVVAVSIQADASGTSAAAKSVKELKQDVQDLRKEFENTKAGTTESVAAYQKLQAAQTALKKTTGDLNQTAKDGTGAFGKLKEGLSSLPGPLGAVEGGTSKVTTAFQILAKSPLFIVITAIVGALTLLYKAFTATDEGAQKVTAVFDGLKAVVQELFQRIINIGSAIYKLFTGDFKGAMEDGKKAVTGFGDAMVDAFNRGKEASDLLDEVADNVRVLDIQYAAMNARLAKSKELLTDENASYKDKKKALQESGDDIEKYYKKVAENDEKRLSGIAKRYNVEKQIEELRKKGLEDGAKDLDDYLQKLAIGEEGIKAVEDAIKTSINSQAEYSARQRQQNRAERQLESQEQARIKEERRKADEEEKARKQALAEFLANLQKLQQENTLAVIKDGYEKEIKQIEFQIADRKAKYLQDFQNKKLTQDQYNQLIAEADKQQAILLANAQDKHNKELADKEAAFQKDIAELKAKAALDSLTNQRDIERAQLKIQYEKDLAQRIKEYKENTEKFNEAKALLDAGFRAQQKKLEDKYAQEDARNAFDKKIQQLREKFSSPDSDLKEKQEALDLEIAQIEDAYLRKVIAEKDYNTFMRAASQERQEIDKIEAENKQKTFGIISQGLSFVADAIGRTTAIGKIAAVAQTTIDTYAAAWSIFRQASKNPATIPFPAYPYIQAGLAVAAGLANIKKILSVQAPGASGGSAPSAGGSGGPAAPVTPAQVSTTFTGEQNPTSGTAAANRTYVLDADIRNANERNERLNRASRLGGG